MSNELKHVGVITDGNGRWAKLRGMPRSAGHDKGRETFWNITNWALKQGIPYLSFYVMSLDNLNRDKAEVDHIFEIGREIYGKGGVQKCLEMGVRLICAGDKSRLTEEDRQHMEQGEADTAGCDKLICVLYVCYGGRDEIVKAARACVAAGEEITEETISSHLYAAHVDVPDPDLIIRTGGYSRLSGFLPWESVYSELYVTPTLYPDFTQEEFLWACRWYKGIQRTHGGDREPVSAAETQRSAETAAKNAAPPFARKEETPDGQE